MELVRRIKEAYDNGKKRRELLNQSFTYAFISMNVEGAMHDGAIKECVEIEEQLRNIKKPSGFLEKLAYNVGLR